MDLPDICLGIKLFTRSKPARHLKESMLQSSKHHLYSYWTKPCDNDYMGQ